MAPDAPHDDHHALDPVDFSTHVMSLASSAMISLGTLPAPDGTPHPIDLDTAKHLIDIVEMLEVKTKGNLDSAESKLIKHLLGDLHVSYVKAKQAKK